MKLLDIIATANRNLTRSKLRTLLTILAIFVGGFTLTLTTALNTGTSQYLDRQLGNVSVPGVFEVLPKTDANPFSNSEVREYDPEKKQTSFDQAFMATMTQADVDKLAAVEGVSAATPYYAIQPEYITRDGGTKYQPPQVSQDFGLNLDLSSGRLLKNEDKNSAVLPENLLKPLGFTNPDDAVNKTVRLGFKDAQGKVVEKEITILGVMRKTFVTDGQFFVSTDVVKDIAHQQGQDIRFITVMVSFTDATTANEADQKARIEAAGNYTAVSMEERVNTVLTVVDAITAGLNVVGIIALVAASFGIINTLLMSVYERTQEIGLMKALGMHRVKVFGLFAIEAVLVGFWGSLVAVLSAWGTSVAISNWASTSFLKDFDGFQLLVVTPSGAVGVILLIMLIAFIAGTLPAIKASRLNPIDALRSE